MRHGGGKPAHSVFCKNEHQIKPESVRLKIIAIMNISFPQDVIEDIVDAKSLHRLKGNCINIRKSMLTNL